MMTKTSAFTFNLNEWVQFVDDDSLPQDIRNQRFKITDIRTILVNDFYFNHELFVSYELTDEKGNIIFVSPFTFEQDNHNFKLRVTKRISAEDLKILLSPLAVHELFSLSEESDYFSIDDVNVHPALTNWVGRTYYPDLKDQAIATISYIPYDSGNRKNVNYSLLLKKYPAKQYSLFLGDYNTFYLEVANDNNQEVFATAFFEASVLMRCIEAECQVESVH